MKNMMRLALLLGGFSLSGCASVQRSMGLEPPRSAIKVEDSQFEKDVKVLGLTARQNDSPQNVYYLRSWVAKSDGKATHQLYVRDVYIGDWKFWERANTEDATSLNVVSISQDVGTCTGSMGCELHETVGADIPEQILRTHLNGFSVKFYARKGTEMVISLSGAQVAAQLAATDSIGMRARSR